MLPKLKLQFFYKCKCVLARMVKIFGILNDMKHARKMCETYASEMHAVYEIFGINQAYFRYNELINLVQYSIFIFLVIFRLTKRK